MVIALEFVRKFSGEQVKGLAIDIHGVKNQAIWQSVGLSPVVRLPEILAKFDWISREYDRRKNGGECYPLILFFDEFEEMLDELKFYLVEQELEAKEINKIILRITSLTRILGTAGRKFNLCPIILNQSWNCTSLKMNSGHRSNFIGVYLNREADRFSSTKNAVLSEYLSELKGKYRAVVTGASDDSPMLHPTHDGYDRIRNKQPPLVEVNVFLADETVSHDQRDKKRSEAKPGDICIDSVSNFANGILRVKEEVLRLRKEGLSQGAIIQQVWKVKPGSSKKYKQARAEYLQIINNK